MSRWGCLKEQTVKSEAMRCTRCKARGQRPTCSASKERNGGLLNMGKGSRERGSEEGTGEPKRCKAVATRHKREQKPKRQESSIPCGVARGHFKNGNTS